jgi:hypothetical protein
MRAKKLALHLTRHWTDETTGEFRTTLCADYLAGLTGASKDVLRVVIFHGGERLNWVAQSALLSVVEKVVLK